jgi:hypothetical protein
LQNGVDEPYARDEAPTLWLRLLCPQAKVAALIGKVRRETPQPAFTAGRITCDRTFHPDIRY